jgi:DNA-binding NtrC family response regulator
MPPIDVIYVEDDETEALLFQIGLAARGISVLVIPDANQLHLLQTPSYQAAQAIFFDLWIGAESGVRIGQMLREAGDTRPFFLLTAANDPDPALLQSLRITYIAKPADFDAVAKLIRAAI